VKGKESVDEKNYQAEGLKEENPDFITPVCQQESNDSYFDMLT
jgi:hypothetical protein